MFGLQIIAGAVKGLSHANLTETRLPNADLAEADMTGADLANAVLTKAKLLAADLIAVDTDNSHSIPLYDPYAHLIYSAAGSDVKHTMVAGNLLMENRKILTLDEPAILQEARLRARRIEQK